MVSEAEIKKALSNVKDPELHLDVVTLGLIYNIDIKEKQIKLRMTLTTPFCPYGPQLIDEVKQSVENLPDVKGQKKVNVELTFEPPWQPNDEVKEMLGLE